MVQPGAATNIALNCRGQSGAMINDVDEQPARALPGNNFNPPTGLGRLGMERVRCEVRQEPVERCLLGGGDATPIAARKQFYLQACRLIGVERAEIGDEIGQGGVARS